ncbi:hypothetical protein Mal15_22320 [Stieleria maiorica]|uniref:Uncharacterized protein n=1 Tax=Stieleria maiorica TaxID=2795974 RepID=A0A5B9MBQ0_9BACT|nr:hypothetical protein [Stieleria maiorica]QEF98183.1 hypothetical protein Mal15_22320 [Stieleria maiorica]
MTLTAFLTLSTICVAVMVAILVSFAVVSVCSEIPRSTEQRLMITFVAGFVGATLLWGIVFFAWARDVFKDLWKHS